MAKQLQRQKIHATARYKIAAVLCGLAIVCATEAVLAALGVKAYEPLVVPWGRQLREPIFRISAEDGERFVETATETATQYPRVRFALRKPKGVCRVFCLGASTVYGTPYGPRTAFPAWLRAGLLATHTWQNVEVINCGSPSITSYRVLWNLREVVRYQPDLIVVYTGHNEAWASPRNERIVESYPWLLPLQEGVQRLGLYALARRAALTLGTQLGRGRPAKPKWAEHRNQSITANYTLHIKQMAAQARNSGVSLVLCSVVSNVRDWPPFESRHVSLTAKDSKHWKKAYETGLLRLWAGDASGAMEEFKMASALDPWYADTYFRIGRCMELMGDFDTARKMYFLSKDFDGKPFRAIESLNAAVRKLAGERGVVVADVEAEFERKAKHGLVGNDLMLDNCHPTRAGQRIIAEAILSALTRGGFVSRGGRTPHAVTHALDAFERSHRPTQAEQAAAKVFIAASRFDGRQLQSDRIDGYREAIRLLREALRLDPAARRAYLFLGMAYADLSYETHDAWALWQARQALRKAVEQYPQDAYAVRFLRTLEQAEGGLSSPLTLTP